jgi:TetR/AcrR family transcriptional regulator, mexJK operon transcriptional repressor
MTQALGRSARKRETILSAGRDLFLRNGYQGTSVDQIAASAEVSKQTVYKHFGDKHELLLAIVTNALESDYLRAVLQEQVVQLRRLVIGEANRVPELAHLYYEQAPARTLAAFADCFSALHARGLLHVHEPANAAEHFAFLLVGRCIDQALFCGGPAVLASVDVDRHVRAGVRVFLAAYQAHTG